MIPGIAPIAFAAPNPVLTYLDNNQVNSGTGDRTHSGLNFGAELGARVLIAAVGYAGTTATSSVTIGGVSATKAAGAVIGVQRSELWLAAVPTGTSGSVVITDPNLGSSWPSSVAIYAVTNLQSLSPVATDSASRTTSTSSALSTSVTVPDFGIVVSAAWANNAPGTTATWTGCTQDFYVRFNSNFDAHTAASFTAGAAQTLDVTTNVSGTVNLVVVTASFR